MRNVMLVLLLGFVGSLLGESAQGSKWVALNAQIKRTQHDDFVDRRTIALQLSNLIKQDPHSVYRDGVTITFEDKFKTTLKNMAIENELEKALSNAEDFLDGAPKTSQNPESEAAVADAVAAWLEIAYNNYKGLPAVDSSLLSEAERTLEILKNYTSTPNPVAKIVYNESYLDQIYNWVNSGNLRTVISSAGAYAVAAIIVGTVGVLAYGAKQANPLERELRRFAVPIHNIPADAAAIAGDEDFGRAAGAAARRAVPTWVSLEQRLEQLADQMGVPTADVNSFVEGILKATRSRTGGGLEAAENFAYNAAARLGLIGPGQPDVVRPLVLEVKDFLQRRQVR